MTQVTPFIFEDQPVRTIQRDGEPWFVAVDVCTVIDIKQPTRAVECLDGDERAEVSLTHTNSNGVEQDRNVLVVNESGLYTLILRSRKATTPGTVQHRFRRWVTSEVLPAISKTGGYRISDSSAESATDSECRYTVREVIVRPDGPWGRIWAIPVYRINGFDYWNVHLVLEACCGLHHVPDEVGPHENARNLIDLHPELIGAGPLWVARADKLVTIIQRAGGCWDNRACHFMRQLTQVVCGKGECLPA